MDRRLFTIGVYGTTEASFFGALAEHGVTHFVDVRRRRGLRGSEHAYANAQALQARLREMGIAYSHALELAPSLDTRSVQLSFDARTHTAARRRSEVSPEFAHRYEQECLRAFGAQEFLDRFPDGARIVLFCVEAAPEACHRSLVARRLQPLLREEWRDITPAPPQSA